VKTNNSIFDDEFDKVYPRPDVDADDIPEEEYEEEKIKKEGIYC